MWLGKGFPFPSFLLDASLGTMRKEIVEWLSEMWGGGGEGRRGREGGGR